MIEASVLDVIQVCGGALRSGSESIIFKGISTDSRKTEPGQIFFALRGEYFDGHDYAAAALRSGASAVVVSKDDYDLLSSGTPVIKVQDTLVALQVLSSWWRKQFDIPVVAVTGSTGKTTTKDILGCVLEVLGPVCMTRDNLNNEIGVPLTLLGLGPQHRACVVEMAMRGLGEIAQLSALALPDIGIITNVGCAHFERLGSQKNIAVAKGELAASVPRNGLVLLNAEDNWSSFISELTSARVNYFGLGKRAHVRAVSLRETGDVSSFILEVPGSSVPIDLSLAGRHNVYNFLAAAGAAHNLGVSVEQIHQKVPGLCVTGMRLQKIPGINGSIIINDTYNANPDSMMASLQVLQNASASRKIACLGGMFELGEVSEEGHTRVGEKAASVGLDALITVGDLAKTIGSTAARAGMPDDRIHDTAGTGEAISLLKEMLFTGDILLVKGSRGMAMEKIVEELAENRG